MNIRKKPLNGVRRHKRRQVWKFILCVQTSYLAVYVSDGSFCVIYIVISLATSSSSCYSTKTAPNTNSGEHGKLLVALASLARAILLGRFNCSCLIAWILVKKANDESTHLHSPPQLSWETRNFLFARIDPRPVRNKHSLSSWFRITFHLWPRCEMKTLCTCPAHSYATCSHAKFTWLASKIFCALSACVELPLVSLPDSLS